MRSLHRRSSAWAHSAGKGVGLACFSMSTCSDRFSEVADTQPSVAWNNCLKKCSRLQSIVEQLEGHAHRVAGVQFAQVAQMHLGRESRMLRFFDVR